MTNLKKNKNLNTESDIDLDIESDIDLDNDFYLQTNQHNNLFLSENINYQFFVKNISDNIVQELKLNNTNKLDLSEYNNWIPPEKYGLSNSDQIIPQYYFMSKFKYDNFNYFQIIKDDIRNMRKLNQYQINYIKKMDSEDKDELIELFNKVIGSIENLL